MTIPYAPPTVPRPIEPQIASPTQLHGPWLRTARGTWSILTVFALGLFVATLPHYVAQLHSVCAGGTCHQDQLTDAGAQALQGLGLSVNSYAVYAGTITIASVAVWLAVAAVIVWRKSDDWMALLVALMLVLLGTFSVTGSLGSVPPHWQAPIMILGYLVSLCFFLFLSLFPDGRLVPRWALWVVVGSLVFEGVRAIAPTRTALGPLWFAFPGILLGGQIYRYRRVSALVQRQQTKWVVFSVGVALLVGIGMALRALLLPSSTPAGALAGLISAPLARLVMLAFPLSIGIAVLRYRLWDIDPLINRTLVYGALTASIIGVYTVVVGYFGVFFQVHNNPLVSLLATAIVAVLFQPLRERLQRAVNRLTYGERDEPYSVLARLGRRLEATLVPDAVLPTIVETVAQALKLPYVAIALPRDGTNTIAAAYGSPTTEVVRLPLVYHTEHVGELMLAPRAPGERFTPADLRLLDDLARHAGVAVHAAQLTADLQRSRERLVTAREEERRRLRNDLHDGLGPQLASLSLKLETARNRLAHDPLAQALLDDLATRTQAAVADIRRVVYALRPPALDDLGLISAVREQAVQYPGVQITIDAPEVLPPLPAAVEVAAYRIVQEALTNVVRHAGARTCHVSLSVDAAAAVLQLEVMDDGQGIAVQHRLGVGLQSMRERAAELGGTLRIEARSGGGTVLQARLPYRLPEAESRTNTGADEIRWREA